MNHGTIMIFFAAYVIPDDAFLYAGADLFLSAR
jgi:hypothetical protein